MKLYRIILAAALLLALCIAPVSAADPVVGTWDVSGTTPFLFFNIPCAEGTVTLNADGSGVMSGSAKLLIFEIFEVANNTPLTWAKIGENLYQVTLPYAVVNVNYNPAVDQLSGRLNPADFGADISVVIDGTATRAA